MKLIRLIAMSLGLLLTYSSQPVLAQQPSASAEQVEKDEQAEEAWYANAWAWALVPLGLLVLFLIWFVPLSTSPETDPNRSPKN